MAGEVVSVTSQTALGILRGARPGSGVVGKAAKQAPAPDLTTVVVGRVASGGQPHT